MKVQLYAYLGRNDKGDAELYVSTGRLNVVGTRVEKGTPLPPGIPRTYSTTDLNYAWGDMMDLQEYFNQQVKERKRK